MRVLDLFSGLCGWSQPWLDARPHGGSHGIPLTGLHDVVTIDVDERFPATFHLDVGDTAAVLEALGDWRPDVLLASPPCTSFSTMSMGRNWTHAGEPKTDSARAGQRLVLATLRLVAILDPAWWIIENPRARLRTLGLLDGVERRSVTYCRLGEDRMKPTDLWGRFPPRLELPPLCHNGNPDHIAAPRGSRGGTQGGVTSARAGLIPRQLAELVMEACLAVAWPGPGVRPHQYSPDAQAMGDCRTCGWTWEAHQRIVTSTAADPDPSWPLRHA